MAIIIASISAGGLVTAIGRYRYIMAASAGIFTSSTGAGLLFKIEPDIDATIWIIGQILAGVGIGASGQLTAISIQALMPEEDMPLANGIIVLMMVLGHVLGLSIGESVFSAILSGGVASYVLNIRVFLENLIFSTLVSTNTVPLVFATY